MKRTGPGLLSRNGLGPFRPEIQKLLDQIQDLVRESVEQTAAARRVLAEIDEILLRTT